MSKTHETVTACFYIDRILFFMCYCLLYDVQTRYKGLKMADVIDEKIKNYKTAPFDARFPNTNQTRNCFQNYLGK